jgi:hypothetical protein
MFRLVKIQPIPKHADFVPVPRVHPQVLDPLGHPPIDRDKHIAGWEPTKDTDIDRLEFPDAIDDRRERM